MNFVGKFDANLPVDGPVAHSAMHAHVDGTSAHVPSDAIIVPDAQLLFGGEFKRSGVDLVLSDDHHELVLHDYFKGEKRVALASPDGAHLTGDLVNALAGHVEYAQADGTAAAAAVVGHVTKLTGTATAIRNGVSIILNQGDNIDKGDVLQSGADSTLGVTFIDGTVFGLSSNARMVVNEMIYDPNGSSNSSLLSLVAGTISFVAGETAKHGDMKVDTPVATMGIRGTAVLVEIDFAVPGQSGAPSANFQVLVEPDGTTGSYILFDKNTLAPLATVNTAGTLTKISQGIVSFEAGTPLTADQQKLITDLFTTKFGDSNTKSLFDHFTDTIIPQSLQPVYLPGQVTVTSVVLITTNPLGSTPSAPIGATGSVQHIAGDPLVASFGNSFVEIPHDTGSHTPDTVSGQINFLDVNLGDRPSVTVEFSSFTYQNAQHSDITASLTPQERAAVAAIEGISVQANPGNNNNGSATWTYSFPDGAFDFLGAGETLTLTYTALVNNNFAPNPQTGTATFTITITGTNDVPAITSNVPQTIAFTGGTQDSGGDLTAHVPTSGTIAFDDPDLTDTHTVSVKLLTTGLPPTPQRILESALTASIASDSTGTGFGTINWKLADLPVYLADFIPNGETITLTYAVTVRDSQGATSTQDITVTITGDNTPAVVWIATTTTGATPGGLWSDGLNWETGNVPIATDDVIIITNQLIGLTPSFPVTIDAKTDAVAKSVTMNDYGTSPPKLINLGSLAVGGAFDMSADSILDNSGTISVGGLMEILDTSVLQNSGTLTLEGGGDFAGTSTITNTGTIDLSGGKLTVEADVANTGGTIVVDGPGTLTLDSGAIDGGSIDNSGNIDVSGSGAISNAQLKNGHVTIGSNATLTLDNDTVTSTSFTDTASGSVIQVDDGTTLTLSGVTINGGTINDGTAGGTGSIHITGDSTISGASLNNGSVTLSDAKLTLDNDTVTGTSFTDTASGSVIQIDDDTTLTLSGVTINGGTINDGTAAGTGIPAVFGAIHVTGASTISNASLNDGGVTIDASQTLTLDRDTVTGTSFIDTASGATLLIDGSATLDEVTITGGTITNSGATLTIDAGQMLTLQDGASLVGGTLDNSGTLEIESSLGATLNGVHVTNDNSIEVFAGSVLVLDQLTAVDNSTGVISIDGTGTLTLNDAAINGGIINDYSPPSSPSGNIIPGDIDVIGSSTISNAHLNSGNVTIEANQTLTLDGTTATGTHFADAASGAIIQIDGDTTLTLSGATINGGTIDDFSTGASGSIIAGDIDVTGSSTISNAHLNNGNVTIAGGQTLTLTADTVTGTNITASGATILIDGSATLDEVTISGGTITNSGATLTIDAGQILTLQDGANLVGGTLNNSGTLEIESSSEATLDGVTITGSGSIEVDLPTSQATPTLVLDDGAIITHGSLTVGALGTLDIKTARGATLHGVNVTNENSIEVFAGSVLVLDQVTTVDNSTGLISIDGTGMLTLDDASIGGGTVTNNGTLTLGGTAALKNGTLNNYSQINVSATDNELDSENITNTGAIAILALGVLTLDHIATFNNKGGLITVYGTGTLTLNDATIKGGTINDYSEASSPSGAIVAGDIDVTGSSTLSSVHLNNGQVTITSGVVLTLDNDTVTGTHFSDTGATLQVDGGTTLKLSDATITGGTINDYSAPSSPSGSIVAGDIDVTASSTISDAHLVNGQVTIERGVVLTLDNDTVTGTHFSDTGATIQIDGGTTLKLDGATIDGGTIDDYSPGASGSIVAGDIDIIDNSTISDASLHHGNVTIESGEKLTLDGDTVDGTAFTNVATGSVIHVDGRDTLTLDDATTITGGGLTIGADALVKTSGDVTLTNTSVTNDGKIEVTDGILKITGSVGSTPGGDGSIQVDNGAILDLDGADTQRVAFAGDGGKLQIDTSSFGGSISGLTAGDEIDLSKIGFGPNTTGTYVSNAHHTGGVLTITDGMHSISMTLVGDYSDAHFAGSSDRHGGTLITLDANDDAPAFAAADKSETATVTELANTTRSSALDPSPAASGTLHFTDIDLTDRPTATVTQSVSWTEGTTSLTSSEIQALEHAFTLTQSGNINNGSLGWTYQISDGALDFLGAGVTATVTSTITLKDHQHGTDTATVTVTIDGANDRPMIVAETNPSAETIILHGSPTVLSAGTSTNSLGMNTETFDSLTAGSASQNGLHHGNFTSTALHATFTASGDAGIVHGSSSVSAAPFIGSSPGHADATNYLSIGGHGSETITFASEQNEFGLYWGSVESSNTISFYDGNTLVASYSGADVAPLPNGNQGSFASSGYVEFSDLAPFDKVVLASGSSNAFEIDNISSGFVSDSHVHLAAPIGGTLTVSDADIGDTLTASVTGNGVAEYNGSTTLPSDVNVSALIDSSAITFDTVQTTGGQDVLDWTYNPGNADLDFLGPGDKLTLTFNALVSDGHATTAVQPLTVTLVGNGAATVYGTAQSETFANVGGGVTIFGNGGQDNFVFNKNFGSATIGDFNVHTDTIDIDHSLFANFTALQQSAHTVGGDTIITDAAHDKLTLTGVTLAQLQAHQSDFHFI